MDTSQVDAPESRPSGLGVSRRSVVRVGAAAAWSVPLVQLATAAPALAVSGVAQLRITAFLIQRDRPSKALDVTVQSIRNDGSTDAGQVTVVVHVPKTKTGALSRTPDFVSSPPAGWVYVGRTGSGPWEFTFITKQTLGARASSPRLAFTLEFKNNGKTTPVPITTTAFAPGVQATSASQIFT